jgi:hypothetical protein
VELVAVVLVATHQLLEHLELQILAAVAVGLVVLLLATAVLAM